MSKRKPEPTPSVDTLTPEQESVYYDLLLAESALGADVQAVCDFGELVFGVVAAPHHRQWVEEVLGNKRVVIVAPPESAKTTWTMILVAWWIGKHPETTNLVVSAGESLANKIAGKIADVIETNPKWKLVFPNVVPDKARGWSAAGYEVIDTQVSADAWAGKISKKKDPTLAAGGVGSSSVNGRRVTGICVADDIHDRSSMTSDRICEDTVGFFRDTLLARVTDEAHLVVPQTRWNPKDVVAYAKSLVAEGHNVFKVFEHPAITADGKSYWPEQWPLARLALKRIEVTEPVFGLVYLANDRAREGTLLKSSWLIAFPQVEIRKEWNRYFGIDFARKVQAITGGRTADPDHFALAVWVDTGYKLVVEDGYDGALVMGDAEEKFFAMAGVFKPKLTGLESNGSGVEYYQKLVSRMRVLRTYYTIRLVNATRNKGERLTEMAPDFQYGMVGVSDAVTPFLTEFRSQWVRFPQGHDDALDAVYLGWMTSRHLLPQENPEDRAERLAAQAHPALTPFQKIEAAYGLR